MGKTKAEFKEKLGVFEAYRLLWGCIGILVTTIYLIAPFNLVPKELWLPGTVANLMAIGFGITGIIGLKKTDEKKNPERKALFFVMTLAGIFVFFVSLLIYR